MFTTQKYIGLGISRPSKIQNHADLIKKLHPLMIFFQASYTLINFPLIKGRISFHKLLMYGKKDGMGSMIN